MSTRDTNEAIAAFLPKVIAVVMMVALTFASMQNAAAQRPHDANPAKKPYQDLDGREGRERLPNQQHEATERNISERHV